MSRAVIATDHYGRQINRNAVITYPVRKGSNMWLETAKVTDVRADGSLSVMKPLNGRSTVITNTDTTILATQSVRTQVNAQIRSLTA